MIKEIRKQTIKTAKTTETTTIMIENKIIMTSKKTNKITTIETKEEIEIKDMIDTKMTNTIKTDLQ